MKAPFHSPLVMLVVALAAAPVSARGELPSVRPTSANQVITTTPTKIATKPLSVAPPPQASEFVPLLPRAIVAPLPREITRPLPGQIVRSLPGQMMRPLPGQIVRCLPGQIVQPLPGQIVR